MKEIINAKNLVKIYGDKGQVKALDGVNISICQGDFIGIMGPSGSGKSTFVNMLGTIDIPTKGTVTIDGTDIAKMGEGMIARYRYENMGFIFQEFNLIDSLTVEENIAVPLALANVENKEITDRVFKMAEKFMHWWNDNISNTYSFWIYL